MTALASFNRTLDQELAAIARAASFECLVCGEFLLHGRGGVIACPECGLLLQPDGLESVAARKESASIG